MKGLSLLCTSQQVTVSGLWNLGIPRSQGASCLYLLLSPSSIGSQVGEAQMDSVHMCLRPSQGIKLGIPILNYTAMFRQFGTELLFFVLKVYKNKKTGKLSSKSRNSLSGGTDMCKTSALHNRVLLFGGGVWGHNWQCPVLTPNSTQGPLISG